jgi:hypothetical protein
VYISKLNKKPKNKTKKNAIIIWNF